MLRQGFKFTRLGFRFGRTKGTSVQTLPLHLFRAVSGAFRAGVSSILKWDPQFNLGFMVSGMLYSQLNRMVFPQDAGAWPNCCSIETDSVS